jgi:hypothetical protein
MGRQKIFVDLRAFVQYDFLSLCRGVKAWPTLTEWGYHMKKFLFLAVCLGCLFFASAMDQKAGVEQNPAQDFVVPSRIQVQADFSRMPLYFVPNQGQMDERVAFYVQGKGGGRSCL